LGVLASLAGFLVASGLKQAELVGYAGNYLDIAGFRPSELWSGNALVFATGLLVTLLFRQRRLRLAGAPVLGIAAATGVAAITGVHETARARLSSEMFAAVGQLDFSPVFADTRFFLATLIFFIIDFFGGVGKYIGLFATMGQGTNELSDARVGRALYVDGIGNVLGGLVGASSVAVFVSSAVGIAAGGRTGLTAVVTAGFMLASLWMVPLVGAIPIQATSGVLVFVGFLLVPWRRFRGLESGYSRFDAIASGAAALVAFATYGLEKAMLLVFLVYSAVVIRRGQARSHGLLLAVTLLLLAAVIAQSL
jgi:adenine/guanine/hypoxanthine permease